VTKFLRVLRKTQGISQESLSAKTGIRQVRLSEYERGLRVPPAHLRQIASALEVPESIEEVLEKDVTAK
jgi:transcriptional regulator with XRE-family HTH domain